MKTVRPLSLSREFASIAAITLWFLLSSQGCGTGSGQEQDVSEGVSEPFVPSRRWWMRHRTNNILDAPWRPRIFDTSRVGIADRGHAILHDVAPRRCA